MAPADPVVSTSAGRVRGRVEKGIAVFRGIPFAQPPIGPAAVLRAPEPPPRGTGRGTRSRSARPPPQSASGRGGRAARPARRHDRRLADVNVWTPRPGRPPGGRCVVWIYGGAYKVGAAVTPATTPDAGRARRPGLRLPQLPPRRRGLRPDPRGPPNRGLLDPVAALDLGPGNIAAFGGDPDQSPSSASRPRGSSPPCSPGRGQGPVQARDRAERARALLRRR